MAHFQLTEHEKELLRCQKVSQLLADLSCNSSVVFATKQQLHDEQIAHRVVDFVYLFDDNYAVFCN